MVQLFGGDLLALDRAAAGFGEPLERAGGAEDMSARSAERIL